MAFFVVRSLDVFQVETDRRIAEMEQAQILTADRERIGRELHDGIIQNIYAAGLSLERMQRRMTGEPERVRRLQAVLEILNRTILDIRNYIFDLRAAKESHELETVLERLVRDLRLDTLLEVSLYVVGKRRWPLSSQQETHLTQIAREALSNVVQHAQAQHVTVTLQCAGDSVRLTVSDDGRGMVLRAPDDGRSSGHGIANMQERTRLLEGRFSMQSEPGHGLQLSVTAPCGDGRNQGRG
jgi:signal transduction histidine kinase